MKCPKCGSENITEIVYQTTDTEHNNYDDTTGCLGFLLFGWVGLLLGIDNSSKTYTTRRTGYKCNECGSKLKKRKNK
jgi:predicted RNA-binding Zn-ribbon protein involved in translation (DUF1610 family)